MMKFTNDHTGIVVVLAIDLRTTLRYLVCCRKGVPE